MENSPGSSYELNSGQTPNIQEAPLIYPPKYQKQENPASIWLRSILSLALYLVLGYYVFPSYITLLLITAIVVIHELGHFAAMKFFRYKDLGIFFIPLLGAYVSGTKREVSQKQSAIILLAGPLPGIVIGIIFYLLILNNPDQYLFDHDSLRFEVVGFWFIFLNLINLLPIYPLDGGQLLNRVFLDEESWIGKIFVILSAALMVWIALKVSYILLIFPVIMLLRLQTDKKFDAVEKRIEEEGINLDTSYEDMPDADYWKTRNILIKEHSSFSDIPPAPPFTYHAKEEKVMNTIQSLLHRHLIQDVSIAGKLLILVIWIAAFAAPWLVNMEVLPALSRFGF
jgi:stage IV sporulation protein FB